MKKLYLTRELPEKVMKKLAENFELQVNPKDRLLSKSEIIKGVRWCDILLCLLTDKIDQEIIDANPELNGIVNYAVGFNNIDIQTATKRKIPVTNTPGVLTETTADFAWSLLFAASRRIVEADKFTRAGYFTGWAPQLFLGNDIFLKKLGIIGAGRIGTAVAKRSQGFKMEVLYYDKNSNIEREISARKVELDELLREADFISLHVPLLPETTHLINFEKLKLMKRSAILVNTSRGAVIDEEALVQALKKKEIAAAGLDVFENEPQITEELIKMENVVLAPHIASASEETRTKMGLMAVKNALQISRKEIPANIVNSEIYEK